MPVRHVQRIEVLEVCGRIQREVSFRFVGEGKAQPVSHSMCAGSSRLVSNYALLTRLICGRSWSKKPSFVLTTSFGIRLTRLAPLRMANCALLDMPDRLERTEPAAEPGRDEGPSLRNLGGGAKSSA